MTRNNALKLLGAFVACVNGSWGIADDDIIKLSPTCEWDAPSNVYFEETGLGKVVIKRKNGKKIEIPFSELFDALEKED